jgi:hypothetical protein
MAALRNLSDNRSMPERRIRLPGSCRKGKYAPRVRMIRLTEEREITQYVWVHPDEER